MDYIHMDGGYYGTSEYMTGGSISHAQCAPRAHVRWDGRLHGRLLLLRVRGLLCVRTLRNGAARAHAVSCVLRSRALPQATARPTRARSITRMTKQAARAAVRTFDPRRARRRPSASSPTRAIPTGPSATAGPTGLTDFAGYGYIHGSCVDESGGPNCGLFGYSDENVYGSSGAIELTSKTFELPAHNGVTLSMRVWKQGSSHDHWETVGITADGATVWESEPLQHGCISGWTNDELGSDSSDYCWSITYDCYIDVELDIAHTASTLTVGFTLHGDEGCGNEGVGFSDFKLTVAP